STRRGMAAFNNNRFTTYPLSDSAMLDYVTTITYIKGIGLIAPTSFGIYQFEKDHWQKIKCCPGLENNSCHQVIEAKEGIYFNYGDRLILKKGSDYELLGARVGRSGPYFRGIRSFNDTTYLATEDGLFQIDGQRQIPIFERSLHDKIIYAFYKDSKNRFWVCTEQDGIMIAEPGNTKEFNWRIPVTQNLVSGFFEDKSGNFWMAGIDGLGLINEKKISRFTNHVAEVNTILETPDKKNILAHSRSAGFLNFTGNDFKISPFIFPSIPGYDKKEDLIDFYCFDDKNRLWLSTRLEKLFCLEKGIIRNYSFLAGHTLNIYAVDYNFRKRRLSIAADTLKVGDEKFQQDFISANTRHSIPHPIVIHSFANGLQVVTTRFDGSFLVDEKDNAIPVNKELEVSKAVYAYRFLDEPGGKFWIYNNGTGISRYHWNSHSLPQKDLEITTSNGLPNNIVNSICIDKYNRVWAVTPSGVLLIRLDSTGNNQHSIYNISYPLEIDLDNLEYAELLSASDGSVWLSKPSEIYRFDPGNIFLKSSIPSASIESIRVFSSSGKILDKFKSLQHFWIEPTRPSLSYNENNLQINFIGISFENYQGLQYSFKLNGLDSNWSQPERNTSVTYVKLSPGHYTFYIRAKNTASDWSAPASFSFFIKTPFWETWWFRLMVIVAASGLIVFIFRYRLKQLKTRSEMQNQIREMEMKALKAQMNPHFIHNALNSIQSLIINNRSSEASHYISKFAKLLRQVLENADKNLISLDKELYSLQLYVDLEKLRMNMDVDYSEQVEENILTSEIKIPPLILQPFVENALWHGLSYKEGNKKIVVSITEKDDWIICEITDNGIGRKKAAESLKPFPEGSFSKAVNITNRRLSDFNQSPNKEPISFIDLEENGKVTGTTVIVRIRSSFQIKSS
ncbi:MAG: histidine kinase, partial [Chitinophagales bacterium]